MQKRRQNSELNHDADRKEIARRKAVVKHAVSVERRLLFVVGALRYLFDDPRFVSLLRKESLLTLPRPLAARIGHSRHRGPL